MKGFKERVVSALTESTAHGGGEGLAVGAGGSCLFFPVRKRSAFSPFSSVQDPRPLDGAAHI